MNVTLYFNSTASKFLRISKKNFLFVKTNFKLALFTADSSEIAKLHLYKKFIYCKNCYLFV